MTTMEVMKNESLAYQIFSGRWLMIFACILIMATAGASYTFSIYSSDIKSVLGYDQTTLNLLGFSKEVGSNFGIVAGLIMEVAPPWVVLIIAACLNFFGYFMIWLTVESRIPKPPVWAMCLFISLGCNSQAVTNTGALIPAVVNFPESRGVVLGLLKGFVGLSGAIITQIYHAAFGDDSKSLILMISILPSAVILASLKVVRFIKAPRNPNEMKVFYRLLYNAIGLAVSLMAIIVLQKLFNFSRPLYITSALIVTTICFLPIIIVILEEMSAHKAKIAALQPSSQRIEIVTAPPPQPPLAADGAVEPPPPVVKPTETGCFQNVFNKPERGEDYTILQGLCSIDMLLICLASASGVGGTITAIDNLGQIGQAYGYPKKSISIFVSLVSVWSFFGRVVTGYGSEILLQKYRFPRPLIITAVLILACCGHSLIAFNVTNGLYVASVIIGFCSGAQWPLMYAVISEIFGLKYYSTLYNFGTMASPVGSYILTVRTVGRLYDKEARRQMMAAGLVQKAGEGLNCVGGECYKSSFLIIAIAAAFGSAMWGVLTLRTRKFYASDIYKKFREEGEKDDGRA